MIKVYKNLKIAYFVTGALGAILIVILLKKLELLLGIVWVIVCFLFFELLANMRTVNLRNQCRLQEYRRVYESYLDKNKASRNENVGIVGKMNLSAAYIELGEPEKALSLLQSLSPEFLESKIGAQQKASYYNNLTVAYLAVHDVEHAEENLACMQSVLEDAALSEKMKKNLSDVYQTKQVLLEMEKGNYEGAEEHFLKRLKNNKIKITQVYCHYYLAEVYRHVENTKRERECLSFAAEHGGDTVYAEKAKSRLAVL